MSPLKRSNNIAARMGRWSASHWKTAVFGWLAFVAAALVIGQAIGTKQIDQNDANVGQSHRADHILRDAGFQADPQTEIVLVQSKTLTAKAPAFRAVVNDVVATVEAKTTIKNLRSPYDAGGADQISADGRTAIVEWDMKGDNDLATKRIDTFTKATLSIRVAEKGPGVVSTMSGTGNDSRPLSRSRAVARTVPAGVS